MRRMDFAGAVDAVGRAALTVALVVGSGVLIGGSRVLHLTMGRSVLLVGSLMLPAAGVDNQQRMIGLRNQGEALPDTIAVGTPGLPAEVLWDWCSLAQSSRALVPFVSAVFTDPSSKTVLRGGSMTLECQCLKLLAFGPTVCVVLEPTHRLTQTGVPLDTGAVPLGSDWHGLIQADVPSGILVVASLKLDGVNGPFLFW